MKAKTIRPTRSLSAAERFECRLMLELHHLAKAANQETDLFKRLARLEQIADFIESLSRVNPELDTPFWTKWIADQIEPVEELLAELYDDNEGWKI